MPRLFVALDLPDGLADEFAALRDDAPDAPSLSFTDPTDAHVTVKFLGDTPEDELDDLLDALERAVADADVGSFPVEVGGLGAFPSEEYIRVVWTGVREGADELTRLHEAVERETTALGFDPEEHEFTPHLTVARMSDARGKDAVQRFLRGNDPDVGWFEATELRLKASELSSEGPTYRTVAWFEV
ncbi:RNA 2',3'-cyclic phosphodiesterase [Halorarum halophilum]|uniref:RNA 2',3'-cyclic phosphodiesterase n=1 Tax=Halorarum halophilum TaxID=2743090 RepID=A0A7D5GIP5_9EURY|nr:RNA 2',3'-cyclic phosphodiesterase [Halobaculum halophilum]QLG28311.1 RNA 2',3'-cyclic phosphodiesterase [Halobaculum halophilum]